MLDIKIREEKIKEKRKQTSFRDFLKEITSRYNFNLFRYQGYISRYPEVERNKNIVADISISMQNNCIGEYTGDFFKDFYDLYVRSPKANILHYGTNENCEFSDASYGAKNCYLSFWAWRGVENALYSTFVVNNCTNVVDSFCVASNCDNIFSSKSVLESSNIFYSVQINNSYNIYFSSNMIGCKNCILCDGLENQSYCIGNKQLSEQEYEQQKKIILQDKTKFTERYQKIHTNIGNIWSQNVTGKGISHSENIENGYYVTYAKDSKNVILYEWGKTWSYNFYDGIDIWLDAHDFYATCQAGTRAHDAYCCVFIWASNAYYCMNIDDTCSYCLWCVGLQNKQFCILNKQYTKEERFELANKIFEDMDKAWTLWQFFPWWMNPFYFNDTAAYLIDDSFTKEEVEKQWYLRREEEIKVDIPAWTEILTRGDLDTYQWYNDKGEREINKEILKKVIKDEKWNYYRIVPTELKLLQKHQLPLPDMHRLERIKLWFKF